MASTWRGVKEAIQQLLITHEAAALPSVPHTMTDALSSYQRTCHAHLSDVAKYAAYCEATAQLLEVLFRDPPHAEPTLDHQDHSSLMSADTTTTPTGLPSLPTPLSHHGLMLPARSSRALLALPASEQLPRTQTSSPDIPMSGPGTD